jgi:hypothetical protein
MGPSLPHGQPQVSGAAIAALQGGLLGLALSTLTLPALAEASMHPAVEAAIQACGGGGASVRSRLEALASASFTMTSDSERSRDLNFLRRYFFQIGWNTANPDSGLDGLKWSRSYSKEREPKPFRFGSALDPAAILILLQEKGSVNFVIESPDVPIALDLGIGEYSRTLTESFGFSCHFTLPDPAPENFVDSLIPSGARVVTDKTSVQGFGQVRGFDFNGQSMSIEFLDMTQFPDFIALPGRAGSSARASASLRLGVGPILLDDSKPRFREVTP